MLCCLLKENEGIWKSCLFHFIPLGLKSSFLLVSYFGKTAICNGIFSCNRIKVKVSSTCYWSQHCTLQAMVANTILGCINRSVVSKLREAPLLPFPQLWNTASNMGSLVQQYNKDGDKLQQVLGWGEDHGALALRVEAKGNGNLQPGEEMAGGREVLEHSWSKDHISIEVIGKKRILTKTKRWPRVVVESLF